MGCGEVSGGQAQGRLALAALGKETWQAGQASLSPRPRWARPGEPCLDPKARRAPASIAPGAGDTVPPFPPGCPTPSPGPPRRSQPRAGTHLVPPWQFSPRAPERSARGLPRAPGGALSRPSLRLAGGSVAGVAGPRHGPSARSASPRQRCPSRTAATAAGGEERARAMAPSTRLE